MPGGDAFRVEPISDLLKSCSLAALKTQPFHKRARKRRGSAKTYSCCALDGKSVPRPLADDPTLKLCERGEHGGHQLARRGCRVYAEVERDQRPLSRPRALHERREVDQA